MERILASTESILNVIYAMIYAIRMLTGNLADSSFGTGARLPKIGSVVGSARASCFPKAAARKAI
ncbi:hypothetical protein KDX25_27570 [Burkholderia cenocepacia]|uniref:hypothetical protein n=1 Tax=Burkholderia cenocepacia TaxID=95486 RepID=UPI000F56CC87|nr:hypothetical protein [Burkholderia cenocepacia]MBR8310185.1 hypothetical protein [Burkholderia cenocepacia]